MDETLGTASFDITKLKVGETKMETFLIGKVRHRSHELLCQTDQCRGSQISQMLILPMSCWQTNLINQFLCSAVTTFHCFDRQPKCI